MNWIAQVGHVSAKDLRYARWPLVVMLAALAISVRGFLARSAFGPIVSHGSSGTTETLSMSELVVTWLPIVAVVLGVLALAALVQADRWLQADSFWTTRPLAPTAVFAAKLLLALAVILVPSLAAALAVLEALHVSTPTAWSILAHAGIIQLSLLLATIVAAALTSDLKGFVTAAVTLLGGLLAVFVFLDSVFEFGSIPSGVAVVAPLVAVILATVLYRRRTNGRAERAAGLTTALLLLIGTTAAPTFQFTNVATRATGPRLSLRFGAPGPTSMILPFMVSVRDTSPSTAFAFARDQTEISGSHGTQTLTPFHDTLMVGPQFPDIGRPIHWLISPLNFAVMGQLSAAPADARIVEQGATSATLSGMVTVLRPHVLATLPLRDGASAESDGRFIGIYGVSHDSARLSVYVHTVNPPLAGRHMPQFMVANFARGEAIPLDEHPSSSSGGGWLVLPWISVASSFDQLATASRTVPPRDDDWYAGASLVAVEWIPVARYRTSATMRLR